MTLTEKRYSSVDTPRSRDLREARLGWALALLLAGCALAMLWNTPINHDTAWYLIATEAWLSGSELYEDIIEVNPPLNFYLTIPAILIAETLGLQLPNAQFLMICVLLTIVLGWSWCLLPFVGKARRVLLLFALTAALVLVFSESIAQRENFMLLFMTPWFVGRVAGAKDGDAMRAAFAAIGLCLKPFFMAYPIALTLHDVVTTRSLSPIVTPANIVFLATGSAYVGLVMVLHPQYFTEIIPVALHVYGEYGFNTTVIFLRFVNPGLGLGLLLVTLLAWRSPGSDMSRFATLIFAAVFIYLIQWTGYLYQFLPIVSFTLIALAWGLWAQGQVLTRPLFLLALLAVTLIVYKQVERGPYFSSTTHALSHELAELGAGQRLMSLSTSLPRGPAVALRNDLVWTSRYPALWLVPGVVNGGADSDCSMTPGRCETLEEIEIRTRADILDDMVAQRPDILIIDREHHYIDIPGFTWEDFLGTDPRWKTVFEDFVQVRNYRRFDIYLHRDLMPN